MHRGGREAEAQRRRHPPDRGPLDEHLQQAPRHTGPRRRDRQLGHAAARAKHEERADDREVPGHRRRVGEEELAVAVEDAETPGRQHQEPGARKEDADQGDGEFALVAREAGRDDRDEAGRSEHAERHHTRHDEREQRADGARHPVGLVLLLPAPRRPAYTGMNDADRAPSPNRFWRRLGIRKAAVNASADPGVAEVVREGALPHQPEDAAEEDPRRDHRRGPAGHRGAQGEVRGGRAGRAGASSISRCRKAFSSLRPSTARVRSSISLSRSSTRLARSAIGAAPPRAPRPGARGPGRTESRARRSGSGASAPPGGPDR